MPASRPCLGCHRLIPKTSPRGRCPDCLRAWDKARGTKTERGYGSHTLTTPLGRMTFDQCRDTYRRHMLAGAEYLCACGCGEPVDPAAWHLGHSDDRSRILGPERPGCNLSKAGKAAHN